MTHVRQTLRDEIATAVTGLVTAGSNVFTNRVYPIEKASLPAIVVTTEGDSIEVVTMHSPALLDRQTVVKIQAIAYANSDLDDTLDTMCEEIETAISNASTISKNTDFLGTEIELIQAENPVGVATLTYNMLLNTAENTPGTAA